MAMLYIRPLLILGLLILSSLASAANPKISAGAQALQAELETLMKDRALRGAKVGVQVVSQESGMEVFAYNANAEMTPASTVKVITAAAALKTLGPSYRFRTEVLMTGGLDGLGVLKGNLYFRGGGDPTLVVEKLWKLTYDLKLQGLNVIDGDLVFDEGFFDTDYALPGWNKPEDLEKGPSYFPSISALSLNFNTVAILVGPGTEIGAPARVLLETPADDYVTVDNQVKTGTRRWLDISRDIQDKGVKFTVKGSIPSSSRVRRYYRAIPDPTAHFIAASVQFMKLQGIELKGAVRRGSTPETAESLLTLKSPPLAAILMDMNKYSNNFMAETILRTMGAEVIGLPGSTASGLQVVSNYLVGIGLSPAEFRLVNGSGLTREAHLRPKHVTAVLLDMARDPQIGGEFITSLAISGKDGTLAKRLVDSPGRLRAKTGTIDGVHCLAGYAQSSAGEWLAFTIMVNGIRGSISPVRRMHDTFARSLFNAELSGGTDVLGAVQTASGESRGDK
jgi:D-alanyl-D-alanine carboxypeptidase/D-alanyl-D-alanine-endopeptidase (penicillin-binding protein 4)